MFLNTPSLPTKKLPCKMGVSWIQFVVCKLNYLSSASAKAFCKLLNHISARILWKCFFDCCRCAFNKLLCFNKTKSCEFTYSLVFQGWLTNPLRTMLC